MAKSAQAFRSIGEVARLIGVAPHVLRYWETQLPQLSPVKRADGRRYYRPEDVELAAGLCAVMREDGMTARGAAKMMARDKGAALRARGAERLAALIGDEDAPAPAPVRTRAPRSPGVAGGPAARPHAGGDLPLFDADTRAPALPAGHMPQQAAPADHPPAGDARPGAPTALPHLPDGPAAAPIPDAADGFPVMADDDRPDPPALQSAPTEIAAIGSEIVARGSPFHHPVDDPAPPIIAAGSPPDQPADPAPATARPLQAADPSADLLARMARVAAALRQMQPALRPRLQPVAARLRALLAS